MTQSGFHEAIRINPETEFYGSVEKRRKQREYVKAIEDLDRAISENSGEPSFYVNRGLAFDGTGQSWVRYVITIKPHIKSEDARTTWIVVLLRKQVSMIKLSRTLTQQSH